MRQRVFLSKVSFWWAFSKLFCFVYTYTGHFAKGIFFRDFGNSCENIWARIDNYVRLFYPTSTHQVFNFHFQLLSLSNRHSYDCDREPIGTLFFCFSGQVLRLDDDAFSRSGSFLLKKQKMNSTK